MRRLTPLGISIVVLVCVAALVAGMGIAGRIMGEDLTQVFRGPSETEVSEVVFHESGVIRAAIGGGAEIRLATTVGSERAIAVSCPPSFEPDEHRTYIVEPVQLETADGRYTPTVWVLRSSERTANTTK